MRPTLATKMAVRRIRSKRGLPPPGTSRDTATTAAPSRRGRPRDPAIDARIQSTALRLFGRSGWSDFSIDHVVRRAGVSKATLYLRWQDKGSLLRDALLFTYPPWTLGAGQDAEDELILYVERMIRELTDETGWALHAALRDPELPPQLRDLCNDIIHNRVATIDRIVANVGHQRGFEDGFDLTLIRKCLIGAAMEEAGNNLLTGRLFDASETRKFSERIVRLILAAVPQRGALKSERQ